MMIAIDDKTELLPPWLLKCGKGTSIGPLGLDPTRPEKAQSMGYFSPWAGPSQDSNSSIVLQYGPYSPFKWTMNAEVPFDLVLLNRGSFKLYKILIIVKFLVELEIYHHIT